MTVQLIKEGEFIIFFSPELDLSGYGLTCTEAACMFIEGYKDFLSTHRGIEYLLERL